MEDRTYTLPPSLWAHTAPEGPACEPLEQDVDADAVVIGGGFTGLSAALHLAEKGLSVRLLEAREPGWGASGRNGGQVNPGWYIDPERISKLYGVKTGRSVLAAVSEACDRVFELISRHQINCEAVRPGYIQAVRGRGGVAIIREKVRQWQALNAPVELLDASRMAELTGTGVYLCGMLDRRGGNLNPLAYARGLAAAGIVNGVRVHGHSPVTAIKRDRKRWRVSTSAGSAVAEHVVFATNAYTDKAWPGLNRSIVPVSSVIAATEPLPEPIRQSILPERHAVSETARVFYYYKLDAQGRFLIGSKGPAFSAPDADPALRARAAAAQFFPDLEGIRWQFSWGGYVAVTPDKRPRLMRLAPGVLAGMGYQGRGVAMATQMGFELAEHVTEGAARIPVTKLQTVPFHAMSRTGVFARVLAARVMDRLRPT